MAEVLMAKKSADANLATHRTCWYFHVRARHKRLKMAAIDGEDGRAQGLFIFWTECILSDFR